MSHRVAVVRNLPKSVAVILVLLGAPALVLASGCGDHKTTYPPAPGGPPNGNVDAGASDAKLEAAAPVDLCGCAVMLGQQACRECNLLKVGEGEPCDAYEATCLDDDQCVADSKCVGACLADAGATEPDCVWACIQAAGLLYQSYLNCLCTQCLTPCSSDLTCPAH